MTRPNDAQLVAMRAHLRSLLRQIEDIEVRIVDVPVESIMERVDDLVASARDLSEKLQTYISI